jgi:hypothetical protein
MLVAEERIMARILLALLVSFGSSLIFPANAQTAATPKAAWTIMVFLNADNNLEVFGLKDFHEMAQVGSSDKVNIIVQMDRTPGYATTASDWKQTLRFRVAKGMEPLPRNAVMDLGEVNMGEGKTLVDFIKWSMSAYPAEKYMLVIWDHGDGWRLLDTIALNVSRTTREAVQSFRAGQLENVVRADTPRRQSNRVADARGIE